MSTKLICVTPNNNNKFYNMTDLGNGQFKVEYGRVGAAATTLTYPISDWNKKYNEKIKKGYVDITESLEQKHTVINEVFPLIVNRTRGYSMYIPKENKWLNHYLVSYGKDPMDGIFYPPRFTISNSKKENETEIPVFGRMMYCPINNQRSSYPLQIYQGNMRMKPDESKVVFANFFMPYLFVFDINKRNAIAIHVIGKKTFEDDFSDDDPTDVELGISDICLTDDYIIALCPNGRYRKYVSNNLRPIVRFLNWEGECLFSFYVDQIVSSMAYDERNKQIFCFSPTSETIYKYDVKKYFK